MLSLLQVILLCDLILSVVFPVSNYCAKELLYTTWRLLTFVPGSQGPSPVVLAPSKPRVENDSPGNEIVDFTLCFQLLINHS